MAFYASQFNGTGTEADPFRPRAADETSQPWQAIDLRADATQQNGWALVWTQETLASPPTGVVFLADNVNDPLSNGVINAINTRLGTSIPYDVNLRQILRRVMTTEAGEDGNGRWNRLRAGVDGKLKIYLGEHSDEWTE